MRPQFLLAPILAQVDLSFLQLFIPVRAHKMIMCGDSLQVLSLAYVFE